MVGIPYGWGVLSYVKPESLGLTKEQWVGSGLGPRPSEPAYRASILPFSKDARGNTYFDWDAGILGALKSAITLPGDVATGKIDPSSPEARRRMLELSLLGTPPGVATGGALPGLLGAILKSPRPGSKAAKLAEELAKAEAKTASKNPTKDKTVKFSEADRAWMGLPDVEYHPNVMALQRKYERIARERGGAPRFSSKAESEAFISPD